MARKLLRKSAPQTTQPVEEQRRDRKRRKHEVHDVNGDDGDEQDPEGDNDDDDDDDEEEDILFLIGQVMVIALDEKKCISCATPKTARSLRFFHHDCKDP